MPLDSMKTIEYLLKNLILKLMTTNVIDVALNVIQKFQNYQDNNHDIKKFNISGVMLFCFVWYCSFLHAACIRLHFACTVPTVGKHVLYVCMPTHTYQYVPIHTGD